MVPLVSVDYGGCYIIGHDSGIKWLYLHGLKFSDKISKDLKSPLSHTAFSSVSCEFIETCDNLETPSGDLTECTQEPFYSISLLTIHCLLKTIFNIDKIIIVLRESGNLLYFRGKTAFSCHNTTCLCLCSGCLFFMSILCIQPNCVLHFPFSFAFFLLFLWPNSHFREQSPLTDEQLVAG